MSEWIDDWQIHKEVNEWSNKQCKGYTAKKLFANLAKLFRLTFKEIDQNLPILVEFVKLL